MPKFTYECKPCNFSVSVLRPTLPDAGFAVCGHCRKQMDRVISAPTSKIVEVLDNGLMTRRVERPANAEQLYKDRARDAEAAKTKL